MMPAQGVAYSVRPGEYQQVQQPQGNSSLGGRPRAAGGALDRGALSVKSWVEVTGSEASRQWVLVRPCRRTRWSTRPEGTKRDIAGGGFKTVAFAVVMGTSRGCCHWVPLLQHSWFYPGGRVHLHAA